MVHATRALDKKAAQDCISFVVGVVVHNVQNHLRKGGNAGHRGRDGSDTEHTLHCARKVYL